MTDLRYTRQKLHEAIWSLTGSGTQKERLAGAIISLQRLKPEDFPEEIRQDFVNLWHEATWTEPTGEEGSIQATVNSMDDDQVRQMIENIISLHDRITRLVGPM